MHMNILDMLLMGSVRQVMQCTGYSGCICSSFIT